MKCVLFLLNLLYFVSNVASLVIVVQPQTIVGSQTLVAWSREDTDVPSEDLIFDLRFVQGGADVGLAKANIVPEDDGSDSGTVLVNFPSSGNYVLKAVSGSPRNTVIGTSGPVQAVQLTPSSSLSSVASSTTAINPTSTISTSASSSSSSSTNSVPSSSTSSSTSQPTSTSPGKLNSSLKSSRNLPAIVGGVIGGLLLLALVALVFVLLRRRRKTYQKRFTFHKDMMVQRRFPFSLPPSIPPNMSSQTLAASEAPSDMDTPQPSHGHDGVGAASATPAIPFPTPLTRDRDVEQGLVGNGEGEGGEAGLPLSPGRSLSLPLGTGHIVPSPKGPRPSIKRTEHTVVTPRPPPNPQPRRTRRQRDIADRISMLHGQMLDVQNLHYHEMRVQVDVGSQSQSPIEGSRSPDSARVRVLSDMEREMVWLRDQEHSPWAMGLTDVLPPGHARYMTP